ncbi:hypothetical protein [Methylomonas sp. MgM2]
MPKSIYLDQNKWIDLAKAIIRPKQNTQYHEVSQLILSKVNSQDWLFPLSLVHFIETLRRSELGSRRRLASVMSEISKNSALKSYVDIEEIELFNLLAKIHAPNEVRAIEPIEYNFLAAIGVTKIELSTKSYVPSDLAREIAALMIQFISDDHLFEKMLMGIEYDSVLAGIDGEDRQAVKMWTAEQSFLKSIPGKLKYKVFFIRQMAPFLAMAASKFAIHFKLSEDEVIPYSFTSNPEDALRYFEGVPSLDTRIRLIFDRMKNPEHKIELHDSRDVSFLATAIPYCDIVITERTWKHAANSQGLCEKYNTVVESDLNYLLSC